MSLSVPVGRGRGRRGRLDMHRQRAADRVGVPDIDPLILNLFICSHHAQGSEDKDSMQCNEIGHIEKYWKMLEYVGMLAVK